MIFRKQVFIFCVRRIAIALFLKAAILIAAEMMFRSETLASQIKISEIESYSAPDLATSILRDNYDIWADSLARKIYLEATSQISSLEDELSDVLRREESLDQNLRRRFYELIYRNSSDDVALRAAVILASRSASAERRSLLKRALELVGRRYPNGSLHKQIMTAYLASLLSLKEFSEAGQVVRRLTELHERSGGNRTAEDCLSLTMVGDVFFIENEFALSEQNYRRSVECVSEFGSSGHLIPAHLLVRRAWVAFRLAKYSEALAHLEVATSSSGSESLSVNPKLTSDLAIVLAVSLTEVGGPQPASAWMRLAQQHQWIVEGLVKTLKYLSQAEKWQETLKWAVALESLLARSSVADEFYTVAIDAAGKSGFIDQQIALKSQAILALQVNGIFAKSIALQPARDSRRSDLVVRWSRDVIQDTDSASLNQSRLLSYVQVVQALLAEPVDLCSSSDVLLNSYRGLAQAHLVSESNNVLNYVTQCKVTEQQMAPFVLAKLEMLQSVWKKDLNNSSHRKLFYSQLMQDLSHRSRSVEVRRMAIETLSDLSNSADSGESERLMRFLYSTLSSGSESKQFERDALVSSAVRMISRFPLEESLIILGQLMLRDLRTEIALSSSLRRELEMVLAASTLQRALVQNQGGNITAAAGLLAAMGEELSPDSDSGRDLLFIATRSYCEAGLSDKCLIYAQRIAESVAFPDHDRYLSAQWLGYVFWSRGQYSSAAGAWSQAGEFALSSGRRNHVLEASQLLVRSGGIFSELKMWPESLKVRNLLLQTEKFGVSQVVVLRAVVDWSVASLSQQAFDVAFEMSSELGAPFRSSKKLSKELSALRSVVLFVENMSRIKARNQSDVAIEESLFLLASDSNAKGTLMSMGQKAYSRAQAIIEGAFARWKKELMANSALMADGRVSTDFLVAANLLRASYLSLEKGCRVAVQSALVSSQADLDCIKKTAETFVHLQERLKNRVLASLVDVPEQRRMVLNELQNLEIKFRSGLMIGKQNKVIPAQQLQGAVLERKTDLLSTVFGERR